MDTLLPKAFAVGVDHILCHLTLCVRQPTDIWPLNCIPPLDSTVLVVLGCGLTNPLEFLPSSGHYTTCCTLCCHAPRYRGALRLFPQFDGVAGSASHPRWPINAFPTSPPLLGDFYKPVIQTKGCLWDAARPGFAT